MCKSDFAEVMPSHELIKEILPRDAAGLFDVAANQQDLSAEGLDASTFGQLRRVHLVFIGSAAAKSMVHVRDRDVITEFFENDDEPDGIRTSGDSNQNTVL